ncbi:15885_t:CDS:2 [Acaulospora morrowiae]|uniref:15885_t:CDS:1 n=1 Tax=Acaulospora morrowiae TaxID=94023 RepID=A0A9N9G591_9GLOM|nr:15885_t:CDS:2 [Acaulospora morrowiae]
MTSTPSPPLDKNCNPYLTPPLDGEVLVTSTTPSVKGCEDFVCLWKNCFRTFNDAELLYFHLSNDHVGRKSTGNLCLVCHWDGCGNSSKKRDHITSHLRVHVSSKPHVCEICTKAFKRPQDLKKHEKIHYTQQQRKIFDNKFTRINKSQPVTPPQLDDSPGASSISSPQPSYSSNSVASGSPVDCYSYQIPQLSDGELFDSCLFGEDYVKPKSSQKRSIEVFEEFYQDVKKQRIDPNVSDALDGINTDQENLPPSLRKKEDLNILENFLTQALKDVELYANPLYYTPTNVVYPPENIIGGGSYNFPDSFGTNFVPEEYYTQNLITTGNGDFNFTSPSLSEYYSVDTPPLGPSIQISRQCKSRPPSRKDKSTDSNTSDTSNKSTESPASSSEDRVTEENGDDDLMERFSKLKIDKEPDTKASNSEKCSEAKRNHALISSLLKKVADLSRHLGESSMKPEDKDRGESVQPNVSSNLLKNSLPTHPISDDKINFEVESLVLVE